MIQFVAPALAALVLAVLSAPALSQTPSLGAEETAIKDARRIQTEALGRDDLDTVVRYWAPEITIRRALGQPIDGAVAARKAVEPPANAPDPATRIVYQREATSVTVSPNWPLAFEEGRWSGHAGGIASKPIISGRYAAQWVKRNGAWLIRSEVFVALDCTDAGCKAAAVP